MVETLVAFNTVLARARFDLIQQVCPSKCQDLAEAELSGLAAYSLDLVTWNGGSDSRRNGGSANWRTLPDLLGDR